MLQRKGATTEKEQGMEDHDAAPPPSPIPHLKRVLNAGSGPQTARSVPRIFARDDWEEVRIDVDVRAKPDLVASITDMTTVIAAQSFDAVWASHVLEHLYAYQVPSALAEFYRILHPTGFALITSPDLEAIASAILQRGLDHVAYTSPAGAITPLDMLFGHSPSIARGQIHMADRSGFTSRLPWRASH